jgi:hypothetical protein
LQAIEEIDISEKAVAAAVNENIESAGKNVSTSLYSQLVSHYVELGTRKRILTKFLSEIQSEKNA